MTLTELSYMCWEILRAGHVVDDERLDIRLLNDWVILKRANYIKNDLAKNPNSRISLNAYQPITLTTSVSNVTDAGDYPYINNTTQLYKIVKSTTTIPPIIETKTGPVILSLETEDLMKLPFSVVDYDHLRFAGNGKFNSKIIFGAIRDNYVYFKYNSHFDTYTKVILRAVFEDPTAVPGFNQDTDKFPVDLSMVDYIKNGIVTEDLNKFLKGVTDEISDSSGQIK